MLNPLSLAPKAKNVTQKHRAILWEALLGTVLAGDPKGNVKYFDYDWDKAIEFAQLEKYTDMRTCRYKRGDGIPGNCRDFDRPRKGQLVLYGIPKK